MHCNKHCCTDERSWRHTHNKCLSFSWGWYKAPLAVQPASTQPDKYMQYDLLLPNLTNIWYKEPLAIRPASTQPDKYMVQNTAYSTTCFYLNWQMYGLSNYDDCEFVLVLFYQKKLSSSNKPNQKSSWLYRFFFGLPLSLFIMKALMMTTLMRKCSRYFHYFRLCLSML